MPDKPIKVSSLQKTAEKYDKVLRTLPLFFLTDAIKALRFNVQQVANEHVLTNIRRHSGGTGPYVAGSDIAYKNNLVDFEHASLKVARTYFAVKDNVTNYDDTDVQFLGGKPVDEVTKRHPLEYLIIENMIKTHSEDLMFAIFHGSRDDDGTNALASFDGLNSAIDALISSGRLNAASGNYAPTGAFVAPTSDSDYSAYENLVDFIGGAHPMLRSAQGGTTLLYITENTLVNVRAALRNKLKALEYPTMEQTIAHLREDALCPSLEVISHVALGLGSRVILCKQGLFDFGWNTKQASQFVQVRNIFEDPNDVQFWMQASYGVRLRDWHQKLFRVNDQVNEVLDLAGDYAATGAVKVTIDGPEGAKWYLAGSDQRRQSGQYRLGLTPGSYTIKFDDVAGYTTPADITITITAGSDVSKTAAYVADGGGAPEGGGVNGGESLGS